MNQKTVFVVSQPGSYCASRPVAVFFSLEKMKAWIKAHPQPYGYHYDWEEIDVIE